VFNPNPGKLIATQAAHGARINESALCQLTRHWWRVQLALGQVIPAFAVVERKMQQHKLEYAKMVRSSQAGLLPEKATEFIAEGGSAFVFSGGESLPGFRPSQALLDRGPRGKSRCWYSVKQPGTL
jgi:hypothetical protein